MSNSGSSSLRPAWKGGGGFQPPPTVTSDTRDRSSSVHSSEGANKRDSNKFSALSDDDGEFISVSGKKSRERDRHNNPPKQNSRGEGLRSNYQGSGGRPSKSGRSLADLASKMPEGIPRSASTGFTASEAPPGVPRGGRRFSTGDPAIDSQKDLPNESSAYKQAVDAANVIRYTREKLLALRPRPNLDASFPPPILQHIDTPALFSEKPQDPVCWDTFDADEIWATVPLRRAPQPAKAPRGEELPGDRRRVFNSGGGGGRWQRGVALPPSEERRSKEKDANSPNDLWDDPVGGVTGAALDFSAFGALAEGDAASGSGDAFDFDKMAEESRKLEEELHGSSGDTPAKPIGPVDSKRPLATSGTTIRSGSGDDVNVFEDFDEVSSDVGEGELEQPAVVEGIQNAVEDPSASSRLMSMIGVKREGGEGESAWNGNGPPGGDGAPGLEEAGALVGLSLNPWGDLIAAGAAPSQPTAGQQGLGVDLASRLESFAAEQKARESAEMERRRRQEQEEAQRRAMAQQQQAQDRARQQQDQQQQSSPQSQVEAVLMERISAILENSWGRSDLVSILSTLHAEDSRVIPLLGSVDLLRDLIAHNPRWIALRQDPAYGAEMAVLQMTNAQWQQQEQQMRAEEEEARRREEQLRLENMQRQRNMSSDAGGLPRINPDAPWFYSDPQGNIQGPFRGDEMRQWLEAGYFKGDLPISQQPQGPFIALSAIFRDLHTAFLSQAIDNRAQEEAEARARAEEEQRLKRAQAIEREKIMEMRRHEQMRMEQESAVRREQHEREEAAARADKSNGANQPSNQLKMLLGLPQEQAPEAALRAKQPEKQFSKANNRNSQQVAVEAAPLQEHQSQAKLAAPAWGGVAQAAPNKKKSMSEIQKEEARRASALAAQQGKHPGQSSSGWANVASTGGKAWAAGTVKPLAATVAGGAAQQTASRGGQQATQAKTAAMSGKSSAGQQQQITQSGSSSAEEFGASMSPALENWCKEQMMKINGTDDLTLVSFCMTLNDASEVRQYLTTYLGSTAQVNNFATEFINKTVGSPPKQDEWATPGSAKKGRKKKGAK